MKTSSLLFLSFLLYTFSANFLLSSAQSVPNPVLDTAGDELRPNVGYYILPADSSTGGGATLENFRGVRCPFLITQDPVDGNNGIPVRFTSINTNDGVIRLSTDLNIVFTNTPSTCPESTVWKLNVSQSSSRPFFVTVDGVEGNPSLDNVNSWFKIEKDGDAYQIRSCPSSSFCPPGVLCNFLCGNIGPIVSTGFRRFAFIDQEPFKVIFLKA